MWRLALNVEAELDDGARSLHVAVQEGHVEVVRTLLEAGADVEAQAANGARPLHCAALGGCAETMGALLELGVDIHAVGEDGCTALREASSSEAVQLLLRLCLRQPATVMLRR